MCIFYVSIQIWLHIRTIDVNKCKFVSLYRSPSQTSEDFEKFTDHLELTLDTLAESNSHLVVGIRRFRYET